jgi:hypothetical protein
MNAKNSIDNERFNKKSDDFYLRRWKLIFGQIALYLHIHDKQG